MDERSKRIQRRFEWPLVIAALLAIPAIVLDEGEYGQPWEGVGEVLNWVVWLVFLLEVIVMLAIVPKRGVWIRNHPLDMAVVLLTPPIMPAALQAARVFRLLRILPLLRIVTMRRLLSLEGVRDAALASALTVLVGGVAFSAIEEQQGLTAWDGVWWAMETVTTVGYGDIVPETVGGRAIAMVIMLVGIGFVALLTAFVADRFIRRAEQVHAFERATLAELREIKQRLERLERSP